MYRWHRAVPVGTLADILTEAFGKGMIGMTHELWRFPDVHSPSQCEREENSNVTNKGSPFLAISSVRNLEVYLENLPTLRACQGCNLTRGAVSLTQRLTLQPADKTRQKAKLRLLPSTEEEDAEIPRS